MNKFKDFIEIDKKFQNSINLQLDIDNLSKLNSYIPTHSSILVLDGFLNNVLSDRDKANILIGPYGKGKSHLLLVLLALLNDRKGDRTKKTINKIEKVSKETAEKIKTIQSSVKPFLPVIISGTEKDLNKEFIIALMESLRKNNLMNVAPESDYGKALEVIAKWQKDFKQVYESFKQIVREYGRTVEEFMGELKEMKEEALNIFKEIHPKLTAGSEFMPMSVNNAMTLYGEINRALESYGYGGIYIIFDEFSKYIEGHEKDTFAYDMKILQDICELANNSKKQQIHITFVAHKSIKEYGNALSSDIVNAFKGVEGRLKEVRFVVSAQNNYELIQHVIKKKVSDCKPWFQEQNNKEIIEESYKIPCFSGLFTEKEYKKIVMEGCFPMLPLTAYALLNISEKVAQNERSIFTFLANDEKGSLINIVENGSEELLSVDVVYDYFQNMFRDSISLTNIHNEWLKADYALTKAESLNEEKIIKAMAILHMINRNEEVPVRKTEIRLATGLNMADFVSSLEKLESKNIVTYRSKLGVYAFKNNVGVNLDNQMNNMIEKQPLSINWQEEIATVSELDYVLPKKYNQEYTMTRYFKYVYMTPEQFLNTSKSEYLFETYKADGLIICLVMLKDGDVNQIKEHLKKLNDNRLVVIYPDKIFGFSEQQNIRKLKAVEKLLKDKDFLEENKVLQQELEIYKEDLIFEINVELEKSYLPGNNRCKYFNTLNGVTELCFENQISFNRFLSEICLSYYEHAPKINNELINRKSVSAQIKKARNLIIDAILNEEELNRFEKGTSSEATIFRATLMHTGILKGDSSEEEGCRRIIEEIDAFIGQCAGKKVSFQVLYNKLLGKDFGTRKGVIPIFIAKEIINLQDTPIIYLQNKEVEISSSILNNINEKPQDYYLFIEKESIEKEKYLKVLEELFLSEELRKKQKSKMQRLNNIVESMQRWYRSLDQYTLTFTKQLFEENEQGYLEEDAFERMYSFRKVFKGIELNPREVLFEKIPKAICHDNSGDAVFENVTLQIEEIKKYMDNNLVNAKKKTAVQVKSIFGARADESLSACLKNWYSKQSEKSKSHIYAENITGFMTYIEKLTTNDEDEIVSRLCKIITGIYINDWKNDSYERFVEELTYVKNTIQSIKESEQSTEGENKISIKTGESTIERFFEPDSDDSTSYFLQNAIEDALEEFGDTLELNQKVSVLVKALEELLSK